MTTALIVEDGTNVADANSFVTFEEIVAYAATRGRSLPMNDDDPPAIDQASVEILSFRAMDYINSRRREFSGSLTYPGDADADPVEIKQTLPFPRTGMYLDGVEFDDETIPQEIKNAQCEAIVLLAAGIDFLPSSNERALKRQKTGPLEKEWFSPGGSPTTPSLDVLLEPFFGSDNFALTVRRI